MENFTARFWGVRGSIPSPGNNTAFYGGNTSCVEVRCGQTVIIFDAGTGAVALGRSLASSGLTSAHLLFSHFHWDHIQGFPFFAPAFNPNWQLDLYGPTELSQSLEKALRGQMSPPQFPITMDILQSKIHFHEVKCGQVLDLGGQCEIDVFPLNHPGPSCGYRVRYQGTSVIYAADNEHKEGGGFPDEFCEICRDAGLVIFDSAYTDDEYEGRRPPKRKGFGHSTWQQALVLMQQAQPRRLALYHHDYPRSDEEIREIERAARALDPRVFAAREGMIVTL